jgi:uncharacterized protein YebE (UPF0316 family)
MIAPGDLELPFDLTVWVLTPLIIFIARICDVSISTVRIIMLSRGNRGIAPVLGFFEVTIWLIAIRQIFQHLDNPAAFIAYGLGFAAGTWIGMLLEEKLALGYMAVRAIVMSDDKRLPKALTDADFGVTTFVGEGRDGTVRLVFTIIPRRQLDKVMKIIDQINPNAFVSVTDVRSAHEGFIPRAGFTLGSRPFPGFLRKGK